MSAPDAGRSQLIPILAAFAALGLMFGVWQVLLADLSVALGLSPGPLGAALSIGFLASLPAMALGGQIADRVGPRSVGVGAGVLLALSMIGFAGAGSYLALVAVLLVFLAASGVYDMAINATAIDLEQGSGRRVLPLLHAAFSGGGAVGAIVTGLLITAGVDFRLVYGGTALLIVVVMAFWLSRPTAGGPHHGQQGGLRSLYRSGLLLVLAAICALSFLSEGAMESWSSIYLRSTLDLSALLGATGVATFHAAMLAGRVATAGVAHRVGRMATLRGAGVLAAAGMGLALATQLPLLVIAGFLVVGLALAGVAPIAFSLAGDAAPGRAGAASSVITSIGYSGFLLGPGLVGAVAEVTSLRLALLVVAAAGLCITALSMGLGQRRA
ncbi:MAG: MFS transporter [Chloroflexota bacterium]